MVVFCYGLKMEFIKARVRVRARVRVMQWTRWTGRSSRAMVTVRVRVQG